MDRNDYVGWAKGLKDAGYATNPNYPNLLINIIQKYNLTQYDSPESEPQKENRENRVLTQINDNTIVAKQDSAVQTDTTNKMYTVVTGDTLYSIARRFGITVEDLKALNNLSDNNIKIGQKLTVVK